MKKAFALAAAAMMALSLTACGGSSSSETKAESAAETEQAAGSEEAAAGESDLEYVKEKGKLVVGITDFAPMDYKDDSGNWIGFDADLATEFAKSIGVDVEFVEIDWDNKIMELNGGTIDCVWNGMTLTDEVKSSMSCTNAYCNNSQVVIVPTDKADQYQNDESLKDSEIHG